MGKLKAVSIPGGFRIICVLIILLVLSIFYGCAPIERQTASNDSNTNANETADIKGNDVDNKQSNLNKEKLDNVENMIYVSGGAFEMGSPETENWRSDDETFHSVTVSDFYIGAYEVTQAEYATLMDDNPSNFLGDTLPVEMVSWFDAITYCNALSEKENLTPAYTIDGSVVIWNRSADGYRLPTEAEWEYACRAGTKTSFNTETSISADEANYYGHYPYEIENNYFSQGKLSTKPGVYREATVDVNSFSPNALGLYNMHGNVGEWVWDYYATYSNGDSINPSGADTGSRRVYRGGGWNDFAKNLRSAYRGALEPDKASFNIGFRLARNAVNEGVDIVSQEIQNPGGNGDKILIAYFTWSGNTEGIAEEIQAQTDGDLFKIAPAISYSSDYNTVLDEAQRDQNMQARPELTTHIENMEDYDTIILGYPNWWASIPMPIASFLEEYDFTGKTIIPFCSHGGGRFGQSLTAIAKLVPDAKIGEGLSVHYSGGADLPEDIKEWLLKNKV